MLSSLDHMRTRTLRAISNIVNRLADSPGAAPAAAPGAAPITIFDRYAPQGHFYSPIPDLSDVAARREVLFPEKTAEIPGVDLRPEAQMELVRSLKPYYDELPFAAERQGRLRYGFQNDFYSYSDGIFLYSLLRHLRPRRYLEIGSGHSSALVLDTSDLHFGGQLQTTFIEPNPERLLGLLRPEERAAVELIQRPVQEVPLSVFSRLEPGDIFFVDSSHVSKIGSDVNFILFQILPMLPSGVYVHFHDIFYPFEYPESWILEGRAYTEAYLLRAFLQYNSAFEIVLFNTYLEQLYPEYFAAEMPLCLKNLGGSIWLRKR